jgi:hypothetical protein
MTMLNFTGITPAKEISELLPEGRYLTAITQIINKTDVNNPKTNGLYEIDFIVQVGKHKGEVIQKGVFTISDDTDKMNKTLKFLMALYESATMQKIPVNITVEQLFNNLVGKQVVAPLKQWKNQQGYWSNNFSTVYPATDYKPEMDDNIKHNVKYLEHLANPTPQQQQTNNAMLPPSTGGFVQQQAMPMAMPAGF